MKFKFIFFILALALMMSCNSNSNDTTVSSKELNGASKSISKPVIRRGLKISLEGKKPKKGETFCSKVVVNNFDNILGAQFTLQWGAPVLKFKEIKNFHLKDLTMGNFGTQLTNDGKLTFAWYDQAVTGVTVANDTPIFEICFDAIGGKGARSKLLITDKPTNVKIMDGSNQIVKLLTETSYIQIQ